ncbi:MAG: YdbL family protein [Hellea sp.]|nr:YdbL family protein [Hellea sp.]
MSKKTILSSVFGALILAGGAYVAMPHLTPEAYAQTADAKRIVDDAKTAKLVGETVSGYLAVVNAASPSREVLNAMNEINIRRKNLYTKLAREQNVQIEVIAALTGEKVIANANRGEMIMNKDGRWTQIP